MKTVALNEFKSLKDNGLYSLAKVEWWLLKYDDYYKDLKSYWYCPNTGCLQHVIDHCSCQEKHEEFIFIKLFEELDEFTSYHRQEHYFKQELKTYFKIKDDSEKLKNWVIRNETIGADECFMFLSNLRVRAIRT